MSIFGALADKLVSADEHGSRGAPDIILGAAGAAVGAQGGLLAAKEIGAQMKELVPGGAQSAHIDSVGGDMLASLGVSGKARGGPDIPPFA